MLRIALIVDGRVGAYHRDVSHAALDHSVATVGENATVEVVPTSDLRERDISRFAGLLVGPGSPYDDGEAVIDWISDARERGVPLVGT